jgi:hypothetical protein
MIGPAWLFSSSFRRARTGADRYSGFRAVAVGSHHSSTPSMLIALATKTSGPNQGTGAYPSPRIIQAITGGRAAARAKPSAILGRAGRAAARHRLTQPRAIRTKQRNPRRARIASAFRGRHRPSYRRSSNANRSRPPPWQIPRLENRHWRPGAENRYDPPVPSVSNPLVRIGAQNAVFSAAYREVRALADMRGWGGRIRTSGWRNQNPTT